MSQSMHAFQSMRVNPCMLFPARCLTHTCMTHPCCPWPLQGPDSGNQLVIIPSERYMRPCLPSQWADPEQNFRCVSRPSPFNTETGGCDGGDTIHPSLPSPPFRPCWSAHAVCHVSFPVPAVHVLDWCSRNPDLIPLPGFDTLGAMTSTARTISFRPRRTRTASGARPTTTMYTAASTACTPHSPHSSAAPGFRAPLRFPKRS